MKKVILILVQVLLIIISGKLISQTTSGSDMHLLYPFDQLHDRFGNRYPISSLDVNSLKSVGGPNSITALPTSSCSAGFFNLYFTQNSLGAANSTAQAIMCQVFNDISGLLSFSNSPLASPGNTVKINILFADHSPTISPYSLATASPLYAFPLYPTNPNPGIIQSQIQKAIIYGIDPYANIPTSFNNATSFYYGIVSTPPITNTNVIWNYNTSTTAIPPGSWDLYTNILHESCHLLGIATLINENGNSNFGSLHNYYGTYDKFLYDHLGNPLLVSSTPTSCPNSNISFAPASTSVIVPGLCTNTSTPLDVSTCSIAVQYSSSTGTMTVYTPNCWEAGSSLSHFEDYCGIGGGTVSPSCYSANGNSNNNQYFVMSNFTSSTSCYVKRYLKEEERKVLCDLGYSVSATYTSNFAVDGTATTFPYSSGACSPTAVIIGAHDGLLNGTYIFTTTATSMVITHATLVANDLPANSLSVSCLELVYSNATYTPGANDFTVSAGPNSGLVLFKYLPVNSAGQQGSPTYVYLYFLPANCNSSGMCNLVNNGGFESASHCGLISSTVQAGCWLSIAGDSHLYSQTCQDNNNDFNLGINTLGSPPNSPVNSYSGFGNTNAVSLTWLNYSYANPGAIKNNLSSPIVVSHTYQLSLFVNNLLNTNQNNNNPVVISIASSSAYASVPWGNFPNGLDIIAEFTVNPGTNWSQLTHTFVFTPTVSATNHYALMIGINGLKTLAIPGTTWNPSLSSNLGSGNNGIFCFVDDISIVEFPVPTFSIPNPALCAGQSFTNLVQYASINTGTFTGPYVSGGSAGPNDFVPPISAPPGVSPITLTYSSTVNSCTANIHQLVTIGNNTNFVTPLPLSICINSPTLDLNSLLTSTNATGNTFSIGGVQISSPYTFPAAGQYTLTGSSTSVSCNSNFATAIDVGPSPLVINNGTVPISSQTMCSTNILTLTASTSGSVTWQPGNLSGATQTLSPTVSTVYTISASSYSSCTITQTLAVTLLTNCCNGYPFVHYTPTVIPTTTFFSGPTLLSSDLTIPWANALTLSNSSIAFLNNAKLIVATGGVLNIQGSHLFSCDNNMWGGIEIQDGGVASVLPSGGKDNLIEDAMTAFDISNYTNAGVGTILDIHNTIFNRNYIDINFSNYTVTGNPNVLTIDNSVFTCRDLPTTLSSWPSTGFGSTVNTASAELRTAINPTTGLFPPYLAQTNFSITNLKNPYSNQPSHIAIQLNNVGVSNSIGMYGIDIGSSTSTDFNLFDAHGTFISALNSNLTSLNNVFQNTQTYTVSSIPYGGIAISHSTSSVMNTKLYLTAADKSVGNKFWNCHTGILGKNIFKLWIEHATFRSTQSTSAPAFTSTGMLLNTNRFEYYIGDNEFTNLHTGINIPLSSGSFTAPAGTFTLISPGIYADKMRIVLNDFTGQTSGLANSFMKDAINISCPNATPWYAVVNKTITPIVNVLTVHSNNIHMTSRGVNLNGMHGYPVSVESNTVVLKDDPSAPEQYALKLTHCNSTIIGGGGFGYGRCDIHDNFLSYSTVPTNTATSSLFFAGNNGLSLYSPNITCNHLAGGTKAFVFETSSPQTIWAGNTMQPMANGLVLQANAKIGAQGGAGFASANVWDGSWTGFHTFVDGSSNALYSQLFVSSTLAGNTPINNGGFSAFQSYSLGNVFAADDAGFNCAGIPNYKIISLPDPENELASAEQLYMENSDLYYFLSLNDSVREDGGGSMSGFFESFSGSNIDKFLQIENMLYQEDYTSALDLLSLVEESEELNTVEYNCLAYYRLYANYLQNGLLSNDDKTALSYLAGLCPGTDGVCVYQAIALYNTIYGQLLHPACDDLGERMAGVSNKQQIALNKDLWQIQVFPNPAKEQINIKCIKENQHLKVKIKDLTGRIVLDKNIEVKGFIAILDIELINGAYIIHISNSENDKTVKKLLISK